MPLTIALASTFLVRGQNPLTWLALLVTCFLSSTASAFDFVKRPATVMQVWPRKTIENVTLQEAKLRIEEKTRTRDAKPFEAVLDTFSAKIVFVSPTGRRRKAIPDHLKPGMRVVVSGRTALAGGWAFDIQILEGKE